jgi:hypothetical protein
VLDERLETDRNSAHLRRQNRLAGSSSGQPTSSFPNISTQVGGRAADEEHRAIETAARMAADD